jgi:hypothetical protein
MGGNGQGRRSRDVLGEISSVLPIPSAIRQRRPMVSVLGSAPSCLEKQWPLFKSLAARLGQYPQGPVGPGAAITRSPADRWSSDPRRKTAPHPPGVQTTMPRRDSAEAVGDLTAGTMRGKQNALR